MKTSNLNKIIIIIAFFTLSNRILCQPNHEWTHSYNGQINDWDEGIDIQLDNDENIIVLGLTTNIGLSYTFDVTVIKYNKQGEIVWDKTYDLDGGNLDDATDMVIDPDDNIFITGHTGQPEKIFVMKLDNLGEQQWLEFHEDDEWMCRASGIVIVDQDVYVSGHGGNINGEDALLLKYTSDGNLVWQQNYNGTGNGSDIIRSIQADHQGNILLSGQTGEQDGFSVTNFLSLKYNTSGELLWEKEYQGPASMIDFATTLAVDINNNVIVAGPSEKIFDGQPETDYAIVKYNSDGEEQWVTRYDGDFGGDFPVDLVIGNNNEIFVTGWSISASGTKSSATLKLDTAGNIDWISRYDGIGYYFNGPSSMIQHSSGVIMVAAQVQVDDFNNEWILHGIDDTGTEIWNTQHAGTAKTIETPRKIIEDSEGSVYITGFTTNLITDWDITTLKYAFETNHAPTDIVISYDSIAENAETGTLVGELTAIDPDSSNVHSFQLAIGDGINDSDNDKFSIENNFLKTAAIFDYEEQTICYIYMKVADDEGAEFYKELIIYVIDVDETDVPVFDDKLIQILPNPCKNSLCLSGNISQYHHLEIISTTGSILVKYNLINTGNNMVSVDSLEPGIYYLRLVSRESSKVLKFLKQ